MNNLQTVFGKFLENNENILVCLDDTFCFAKSPEKKPKCYISITSISDKDDVIECLKEEGSSVINFKISSKGKSNINITKVVNSLVSILVENSFEPFMLSLLSNEVIVGIVISDRDVNVGISDSESGYDSEDDEHIWSDSENIDDKILESIDGSVKTDDEFNDTESVKNEPEKVESDNEEDVSEKVESDEEEKVESDNEENVSEKVESDNEEKVESDDKVTENKIELTDSSDDETSSDISDDSDDELSYINSLKDDNVSVGKMKRKELIEHLYNLKVKKIDGIYTRNCTKENLIDKLKSFLEN